MREIKFRGLGFYDGTWVFGLFNRFKVGSLIFPCIQVERESDNGDYLESYEINGETLGQYTGLKDKNGKDIYEGDIILADWRSTPCKWKVYCDSETQYWDIESHHGILEGLYDYHIGCMVIGNIYEHPHLLEEHHG